MSFFIFGDGGSNPNTTNNNDDNNNNEAGTSAADLGGSVADYVNLDLTGIDFDALPNGDAGSQYEFQLQPPTQTRGSSSPSTPNSLDQSFSCAGVQSQSHSSADSSATAYQGATTTSDNINNTDPAFEYNKILLMDRLRSQISSEEATRLLAAANNDIEAAMSNFMSHKLFSQFSGTDISGILEHTDRLDHKSGQNQQQQQQHHQHQQQQLQQQQQQQQQQQNTQMLTDQLRNQFSNNPAPAFVHNNTPFQSLFAPFTQFHDNDRLVSNKNNDNSNTNNSHSVYLPLLSALNLFSSSQPLPLEHLQQQQRRQQQQQQQQARAGPPPIRSRSLSGAGGASLVHSSSFSSSSDSSSNSVDLSGDDDVIDITPTAPSGASHNISNNNNSIVRRQTEQQQQQQQKQQNNGFFQIQLNRNLPISNFALTVNPQMNLSNQFNNMLQNAANNNGTPNWPANKTSLTGLSMLCSMGAQDVSVDKKSMMLNAWYKQIGEIKGAVKIESSSPKDINDIIARRSSLRPFVLPSGSSRILIYALPDIEVGYICPEQSTFLLPLLRAEKAALRVKIPTGNTSVHLMKLRESAGQNVLPVDIEVHLSQTTFVGLGTKRHEADTIKEEKSNSQGGSSDNVRSLIQSTAQSQNNGPQIKHALFRLFEELGIYSPAFSQNTPIIQMIQPRSQRPSKSIKSEIKPETKEVICIEDEEEYTDSPTKSRARGVADNPIDVDAEEEEEDYGDNDDNSVQNAYSKRPISSISKANGFVSASQLQQQRGQQGSQESENDDLDSETRFQLSRLYSSIQNKDALEEMEPSSTLTLTLRPYQKQALSFMVKRENNVEERKKIDEQRAAMRARREEELKSQSFLVSPNTIELLDADAEEGEPMHPFYIEQQFVDGTPFYLNRFTGELVLERPVAPPEPQGGILADEMGLGKTIMVLALLLTNGPTEMTQFGYVTQNNSNSNSMTPTDAPKVRSRATLIVCPLTLVAQWETEIKTHSNPQLKIYTYYGQTRERDPLKLADHDVIITTYNTLSSEYSQTYQEKHKKFKGKEYSPLYRMRFFRCVLDEAHQIKNRKSNQAKAAFAIDSERRWCLTGTPIQNSLDDMFSLFHFLRVDPFGEYNWWNQLIARPFERKDPKAFLILQTLLQSLMLRRTKDQKIEGKSIVSLPSKHIATIKLTMSGPEQGFYEALLAHSKNKFKDFVDSGTVLNNYANILDLLLRLRQSCDHPVLVLPLIKSDQKLARDPRIKEFFSGVIEITDDDDIVEILDTKPASTPTSFNFIDHSCYNNNSNNNNNNDNNNFASIQSNITSTSSTSSSSNNNNNNSDEANFDGDAAATGEDSHLDNIDIEKNWKSSTKISALLDEIQQLRRKDPEAKSVVFSQWTSMLDLIQIALRKAGGIEFVRLDGSMNKREREKAVVSFRDDKATSVMLISLKAGGIGLNLVWATHVFMMDPWWNPAVEEQAIDRVHRIGQKREVTVKRFVIENSVEEKILAMQQKKEQISRGMLTMSRGDQKKMRVQDLELLFA